MLACYTVYIGKQNQSHYGHHILYTKLLVTKANKNTTAVYIRTRKREPHMEQILV
jgi:hypothetical protein